MLKVNGGFFRKQEIAFFGTEAVASWQRAYISADLNDAAGRLDRKML
jgi:hypothetical protein